MNIQKTIITIKTLNNKVLTLIDLSSNLDNIKDNDIKGIPIFINEDENGDKTCVCEFCGKYDKEGFSRKIKDKDSDCAYNVWLCFGCDDRLNEVDL